MKKICLLFVITILLLCTACNKTEITHDAFFDTFLLTDMRVDGISVPALFNPAKGTMTPLCTDPLCAHTEKAGCPFAWYNTIWEPHETYEEDATDRGIWYDYAKEDGRIVYDTVTGTTAVYIDAST